MVLDSNPNRVSRDAKYFELLLVEYGSVEMLRRVRKGPVKRTSSRWKHRALLPGGVTNRHCQVKCLARELIDRLTPERFDRDPVFLQNRQCSRMRCAGRLSPSRCTAPAPPGLFTP